ncbi:MAG TPA: UDP-N-acetylmuramate dehydrogenase [Chitinophagales bacterium]|jgi:UDP-N-acetylmuramate dehydrogenase|nr:UDP-N-acetylmuramate dehydrogenase [Chitinophagales bacterium]HQW79463.1 UDP-N-acetylmuramate dehydrogenase [Chitinophagales bacterium]HRB19167.1 UDP-N-acetylmuramate dehydrogenase [Chitinophagales bacterium]HRB66878.1 UDP-N-acetylmuramate dehydrogenase [Chitinophagales bacterium]HRB69811.1 UDP-N-acetylmuramate dehydrogenase [Chitinophagales bacterium]
MISIKENISLKQYNTFNIDVNAAHFCCVQTLDELKYLIHNKLHHFSRYLFIGGGSNILFCSAFDGLVILNKIKGIEISKEDEQHVWIKANSGTTWHDLVLFAVSNNFGGIENMSLIPGTVGAAPMQNIGAYGVELKDVFEQLTAIDIGNATMQIFNKEACAFGYRESIFKRQLKDKFFIYSVTLKLSKHPVINSAYGDIQKVLEAKNIHTPNIQDISDAVIFIRQSKLPDPNVLGNAGSFFKNPEVESSIVTELTQQYPTMPKYNLPNGHFKIPAAWLIEQCGWKGKRIGNTGNHSKQALVIVNYGNAKGHEIWQHAQNVQQTVKKKFGIHLEMEVNQIQ